MVYIQERDELLLKMMGKYGTLNNKTITRIYDNKKVYPRHRKKTLSDAKYIIKTNRYAYLGKKGREYLNCVGVQGLKQISGFQSAKKRLCKISEILVPLEGIYNCSPSWYLKDAKQLCDRGLLFYGKIRNRNTGDEYYIYNAGKMSATKDVNKALNLKKSYIRHIKEEIVQNALIRMNRVIILAEDGLTIRIYKKMLDSLKMKEQLIMPFTDQGIDLLKELGKRNIKKEAIEYLYGKNYRKPDWIYADFATPENKQGIVLINNDGEKIVKIQQNQMVNQYNYSKKNSLVIICLENQVPSFQKEFPGIKLLPLPNSFIWKSNS